MIAAGRQAFCARASCAALDARRARRVQPLGLLVGQSLGLLPRAGAGRNVTRPNAMRLKTLEPRGALTLGVPELRLKLGCEDVRESSGDGGFASQRKNRKAGLSGELCSRLLPKRHRNRPRCLLQNPGMTRRRDIPMTFVRGKRGLS